MVTRIGKVLVFVNLFIAVGLFAWAVSLYANRPDWFDRTEGEGLKVEGTLTRLKAEVDRVSAAVRATQGSYARASGGLYAAEAARDYRRRVLGQWLNEVKDTNNPNAVFKEFPRLPNSALLNVGGPGQPPPPLTDSLGVRGQPLPGLGRLATELRNHIRDEKDTKAQIVVARTRLDELATQINLTQAETLAQRDIRDNLLDQEAFLADAQINWDETLRTLRLREGQLAARLAELGGAGGGSGN